MCAALVVVTYLLIFERHTLTYMQNLVAISERWERMPGMTGTTRDLAGVSYIPDLDGFVACLTEGEIVLTKDDGITEAVGAVDGGIAGSGWAPDCELFSVISKSGNLLFLSNSFDPIGEVEVDQGRPVDKASVSWRGDGSFAAVLIQRGTEAFLRTWNREGMPFSPMVSVPFGPAAVAFQPSGVFIAVGAPTGIGLYELNGQSRGSIATRFPPEQLAWDASSDALCALCGQQVCVFSLSNGRWYQRWTLLDPTVSSVVWDASVPLRLKLGHADGSVRVLTFVWDVIFGDDQHTVAVRDGGMCCLLSP